MGIQFAHTKKKLYLWPRGSIPEGILAPALRELIRVEGKIDVNVPTDVPVRGLVFKGLTLAHADRDAESCHEGKIMKMCKKCWLGLLDLSLGLAAVAGSIRPSG